MADVVSKAVRSRMMSGIKGKDTKPELLVRKGLHKLGFRYRIHGKELPGKPDIVLHKYNAAIFVNGCFWHMHDCHLFKWPSTRPEFWKEKLERNVRRDKSNYEKLRAKGWRVGLIWECSIKGRKKRDISEVIEQCSLWIKGSELEMQLRGYK